MAKTHLHTLVDSEAVNVELGNHEAGEVLDPSADGRVPLAKAILHGGELCQLTLPIGVQTKGFDVAVLIKVAVVAARELGPDIARDGVAGLVPEGRVVAGFVVLVAKREVAVLPARLPDRLVLLRVEGGGRVEVVLEADEIAQGRHGVLHDDKHVARVNGVDRVLPFLQGAVVKVEEGEVQRRVRVGTPRLVDEGRAGDVDGLYMMVV